MDYLKRFLDPSPTPERSSTLNQLDRKAKDGKKIAEAQISIERVAKKRYRIFVEVCFKQSTESKE